MNCTRIMPATLVVLLFASACQPEEPGLAIQLQFASRPLNEGGETGKPPADIDAFRLCVQDGEGRLLRCKDFNDLTAGKVRLGGIATGTEHIVTFQGYRNGSADQAPEAIWCGRATRVSVQSDQTTTVRMLLSLCGDFSETPARPATARVWHSATLLPNGKVLLAGGFGSLQAGDDMAELSATSSVEIYDPVLGSFSASVDLSQARGLHAAMALSDGRVLLAGGCTLLGLPRSFSDPDQPGSPLICLDPGLAATTAEIVDVQAGTSELFDIPFSVFSASVPLSADRMLLAGGRDEQGQSLDQALLINAADGSVSVRSLPHLLTAARHSALALSLAASIGQPDEALVIGGMPAAGIDDPGDFAEKLVIGQDDVLSLTPKFVSAGIGLGLPVMHAAGCLLSPGRLLVAGGANPARYQSQDTPFLPAPLQSGAVIDLRAEQIKILSQEQELNLPRLFHTITAVDRTGNALVVGGFSRRDAATTSQHQASDLAEGWSESDNSFSLVWLRGEPVHMKYARAGHTTTRLGDGTLLITGGMNEESVFASAEIFNPFSTALEEQGLPVLW